MCNVYRLTYVTRCGKTNQVIETGDDREGAVMKARLHVEDKHTPMKLLKIECRRHGTYFWTAC